MVQDKTFSFESIDIPRAGRVRAVVLAFDIGATSISPSFLYDDTVQANNQDRSVQTTAQLEFIT